jgi:cation-transporting P-type ATPase C
MYYMMAGALAAFLLNPNTRQAFEIWRLKRAVESWERERDRHLTILHHLPGRLRLGVTLLPGNVSLAERLENSLINLDGISRVQANPVTGSLLIAYDPTQLDEALVTAEVFAILMPPPNLELSKPATAGHTDDALFQVTIIHALPGRVRLQAPIIPHLDRYEPTVVHYLQSQAGIETVHLNALTASALICFDETQTSFEEVLQIVGAALTVIRQIAPRRLPVQSTSIAAESTNLPLWSLPLTTVAGPGYAHPLAPPGSATRSRPRPPVRPRTVQERSMYEQSSRDKLVDVLISSLTLALTSLSRGGTEALPAPFVPQRFLTPPALTALAVGLPIFRNGLSALLRGGINADTLSTIAILTSLLVGKDLSALIILLLADIGEMITAYSAERTREAIVSMLSVGEPYVWQVRPDGTEVKVSLEGIQPGDTIAVHTGEKISVDGIVVGGEASVDQASITGEFMPMHKTLQDQVFAGTLLKRGRLLVRAEQVGDATAVARILHLVEEASQRRAPIQNFADKFSQQLLPINFVMAALVFALTRDLNRALNMLIIDYSCGVRLSTATAFSSSVFNAARQGILVKGGSYLEQLNNIDTLILDKTGTVTEGKPSVVEVQVTSPPISEQEVVVWAASAEQHTAHPLADAIVSYANTHEWGLPRVESEEVVVSHGVQARVAGQQVLVGSRHFMHDEQVNTDMVFAQADRMIRDGQTVVYVALDGQLIGLIGIRDALRQDMKKALNRLRRLGIDDVILLTGDIKQSAEQVATRLAVDRFLAGALPEDKAELVQILQAKGVQVAMVGDGVNDAPALALAAIGIAMGSRGTELAIETADITIAGDDPLKIPVLFQISRQTMFIVRQNFTVALGVNTLAIILGALGYISPMTSAVLHNATTVGVVFNSARLLFYKP